MTHIENSLVYIYTVEIIYLYTIEFIYIYVADITMTSRLDPQKEAITNAFNVWNAKFQVPILECFLLEMIKVRTRYGGELVELARYQLDENIKIPTVYSYLKRLEEDGFIEQSGKDTTPSKGPKPRGVPRRYYDITSHGVQYLEMMRQKIQISLEFMGGN